MILKESSIIQGTKVIRKTDKNNQPALAISHKKELGHLPYSSSDSGAFLSEHIFLGGSCYKPLRIINTEGHITCVTLFILSLYSPPFIDTQIPK